MKKKIHPEYHTTGKITCSCGNIISVGSTKSATEIEVCSACHPFYTGKRRLVDTAGQLDRFKKRMAKSEEMLARKLEKKEARKTKKPKEVKSKIVKKGKTNIIDKAKKKPVVAKKGTKAK